LTVGTILNAAFDLYRRQVRGLWAIVALIVIPAQALVWIMIRVSLTGHARAINGVIHDSSSAAVPTVAILLLGFLSAILVVGALSRLLGEAYSGLPVSWQESLGYASSQLLPLVALAVVEVAGVVVGLAMFVLPAIFLAVAWSASVPALMLERVGPIRAISRSWSLVQGHWWIVFGALLIALGIIVGVNLLGGVVAESTSFSSVDAVLALNAVTTAVADLVTFPLLASITVVVYVELRALKEGLEPGGVGSATP
jgi:hypothetical protein